MARSRFNDLVLFSILLSIAIIVFNNLYFTINYAKQMKDESHNVATYLQNLKNANWFADIIDKRIKVGMLDMDQVREEDPPRGKNTVTPYLKRKRNPEWFKVVAREFKDEAINIGLVNMDAMMDGVQTKAKMVKVHFDRVGEDIHWSDLSPELMNERSVCPDIPMPRFEEYKELDVVVASYRTGYKRDGSRDISRLQVNLVVANLLVRSGRKGNGPVLAVFVETVDPMWEIFRCDDLFWNEGNTWIYKPELTRIEKLVFMPVGPCQYVPPLSNFNALDQELRKQTNDDHLLQPREAYITLIHSSEDYVCGAIVLAQSIIQTNTTKDLVLLADDSISAESIKALQAAGWKTHRIERIRSPYSRRDAYNEWNYSKLRIWELKQYEKLMFIDADLIVIKNIDEFFIYPQLTAVGNYQKHLFNSGLMLVEPSQCTFNTLMKRMEVVESYNGGDQGFLNEMFAWWHRLPHELNFMKVFVAKDDDVHLIDDGVFAVHYTGRKPWKCADEEHDCNWDAPEFHRYASDTGHSMWWRVYRTMPENLRPFCSRNRFSQ